MTNTKKVVEFTHPELVMTVLKSVHRGEFPTKSFQTTFGELLEAGLIEAFRIAAGGVPRVRLTAAGKARLRAANDAARATASAPVEVPDCEDDGLE